MALKWESLGAERIHIVDLDGAAAGDVVNLEVVRRIASAVRVPVQLGGGIRTLETIEKLLEAGIARVILGTAAVENTDMVSEACRRYAGSIIVSIDARNGQVATRGWLEGTGLKAVDLGKDMVKLGVRRFIYTDISRDGTLVGPNYEAIAGMVEATGMPVIAAGGVSSVSHLKELRKTGVEGAIIGRALYTGDIDLKEALRAAK